MNHLPNHLWLFSIYSLSERAHFELDMCIEELTVTHVYKNEHTHTHTHTHTQRENVGILLIIEATLLLQVSIMESTSEACRVFNHDHTTFHLDTFRRVEGNYVLSAT